MAKPRPFKIAVENEDLSWLTDRIKTTRLPPGKDLPAGKEWSFGLPVDVASRLHSFWANEFDWRKVEAKLNRELEMYTLPLSQADEELTIHFVHHVSPSPDAIPLLFIHGWPGSFLEVNPIIKELTQPSSPEAQAYHVVAPSLPGFGFSSYPKKEFGAVDIAAVFNKLMLALGYDKYMAQGGDWGSIIARVLAQDHSTHCTGIHLNMVFAMPPSLTKAPIALARLIFCYITGWWSNYDAARLKRMKWWMDDENGYRDIQGTKPQTISYSLTDSPFGMMCWIRDKLEYLVDDDFVWDDETVITWAMIYVLNGTSGHAEIYKTALGEGKDQLTTYMSGIINIPVGVSVFPKDVLHATRWWTEATAAKNVVFWKEHDKGGHFPSIEKPMELIGDIRSFTMAAKIADKVREPKNRND